MKRSFRRLVAASSCSLSTILLVSAFAPSAMAASGVPYQDEYANGTITLCSAQLQPITEGSINQMPFVWRAVGSVAAAPGYAVRSGTAALYAFQPRAGVDPGQWSGQILTAVSSYRQRQHPMAQATAADWPLRYFTDDFKPQWDGYVELRLYYQRPGTSQSTSYAAADLRIDGNSWTLVRGGSDSCGGTGDAKSIETTLPSFPVMVKKAKRDFVKYASATPGVGTPVFATPSPASSSSATSPAGSGVTGQGPQGVDSSSPAAVHEADQPGGIPFGPIVGLGVAVALVVLGIELVRRRSR